MKANITNNKKNTTMRKIVPAAGMLSISAVMLATSTYAWFTMSREVEVQNIQMTATTPEDIQISLGTISNGSAASTTDAYSLAGSTGILATTNKVANAPRVDHDVTGYTTDTAAGSLDWSNIADISAYYEIGKLMPASSTTGLNVFYTPDANGVGKTVKDDAKFYQAATALTAGTVSGTSDMATLHAATTTNKTATANAISTAWLSTTTGDDKYTQSTAWNASNDDGYYVDIPIWLRTSSTQSGGTGVSVDAYVIPKGATSATAADENDRDLYKAIRVAILSTGDSPASSNLIPVRDGLDGTTFMTLADPYASTNTNTVFTNGYYKRATGVGAGKEAVASVTSNVATYDDTSKYTAGSAVTTLAAGSGTQYGDPTKLVVRVWLEGEDMDCWNETAGQDFSINIKFTKV